MRPPEPVAPTTMPENSSSGRRGIEVESERRSRSLCPASPVAPCHIDDPRYLAASDSMAPRGAGNVDPEQEDYRHQGRDRRDGEEGIAIGDAFDRLRIRSRRAAQARP